MKTPVIKTKNLLLVPLSDEELEALMLEQTDGLVKSAYGHRLEGCRRHHVGRLWHTAWEMRLKSTGERVGDMGFKGPPANNEAELSYAVCEAFRGRGYATEAVGKLADWAFSNSGELYFLTARIEPGNTASQRVLEKNGFVPAGSIGDKRCFEKERPVRRLSSLLMCMGMCAGMAVGLALDNLSAGLCIGLCVGLAIGYAADSRDRRRRFEIKRARIKARRGGELPPEAQQDNSGPPDMPQN